jgi:hypothetical protein
LEDPAVCGEASRDMLRPTFQRSHRAEPPTLLIRFASAAVLGTLAAPAVASATDYCVLPATGCAVADTYPASAAGVQAALDAALVSR